MKADRTVVVFGVFLFLIGLAVAWSSYGFIQLERGWSMVISGTIAFCAGLILIGLGLILRQLKILSASAAQVALFLAKAGRDAAAAAPAGRAPEAETEAPQAPLAEEAGPAEQAPAPAAEEFTAPPPAWMRRATTYAAAFGAARATEPDAAPEEGFLDENRDWLAKAVAEEVAAQEDLFRESPVHQAAAEQAPPPEAIGHEAPAQQFPAHKFPAQELPAQELPAQDFPAQDFPAEEGRDETVAELAPNVGYGWENAVEERVEAQEPEEIGALAPEPAEPLARHEPVQAREPAPEPHEEGDYEQPEESAPPPTPAILGQYEANGARYTLYVDGSIDAETAHGVYRFASMDELKRFLEGNE